MEPSQFGQEVSLIEARKYVEAYKSQRDTLITEVLTEVPPAAPVPVHASVAFHKSEVNAFIFDAASITRFFEGADPARYLMVFLGADGIKPTVVAAGVKAGPEPGTFSSVFSDAPGSQHPGIRVDATFPEPGGTDAGKLYVKMV